MTWLKRWWKAHYVRVKRFEATPNPGLFQFGVVACDDPARVADFLLLRLPIFGYGYDINNDDESWGQRALFYHSRRGFKLIWLFDRRLHEAV